MKRALAVVVFAAFTWSACTSEDAAQRARDAAERLKAQMGDRQGAALSQEVSPETVREVQEHLRTLSEYLGKIDGELDGVTVNAIEAFQTAHGLNADGILTEDTLDALRAAAQAKKAAREAS